MSNSFKISIWDTFPHNRHYLKFQMHISQKPWFYCCDYPKTRLPDRWNCEPNERIEWGPQCLPSCYAVTIKACSARHFEMWDDQYLINVCYTNGCEYRLTRHILVESLECVEIIQFKLLACSDCDPIRGPIEIGTSARYYSTITIQSMVTSNWVCSKNLFFVWLNDPNRIENLNQISFIATTE